MKRRIVRTYFFSNNEVHEAIVAMLKARNMPAPEYVGNAGTTKWTDEPQGIRVEWIDDEDVVV